MNRSPETLGKLLGLMFGVLGPAHLLFPRAFEGVNRLAFGDDCRRYVLINGAIETALGSAIVIPSTRRAAYVGTAVYGTYFMANVLAQRRRARKLL